jgi:hypothetical protein
MSRGSVNADWRSLTHDEWKDFFTDDEEKSYGYASDEDSEYNSNETFEEKPTDVLATIIHYWQHKTPEKQKD